MDLAIELVASQWGLVVPVELVVELEMTVVLKEVVGVGPTVEGVEYESRIDWSMVGSVAHSVVAAR